MVSHRNYLAMTAVMIVVLFLFQFTNIALESWNDYESNSYAVDREFLPAKSGAYGGGNGEKVIEEGVWDVTRDVVVYIGGMDEPVRKVTSVWSAYTKKQIKSYKTLEEYEDFKQEDRTDFPKIMVVNSGDINWDEIETIQQLQDYAKSGIDLVFSGLPDASVINDSSRLKSLLGIREVKEETAVAGLRLYEGFLLGGEIVYQAKDEEEFQLRQDMELQFPWYTLAAGTKTYMSGVYADRDLEEEECPPVIWRNRIGRAYIYVVNGTYMEDAAAGLGLLSAMWAQSEDYVIYPVINAQNMVIANYPGLSEENNEEMMRRYGRTMPEMMRYNVWPAIVAAYQKSSMGLSCMLAPQYDYDDNHYPDQSEFLYYMKRLSEQRAEVGLSGESISETPLMDKLKEDARFIAGTIPGYQFASFYGNNIPEDELSEILSGDTLKAVRTVITNYDENREVIGYQSEHVTRQSVISDGFRHTFFEDFRVKAVETALAYTNVSADMGRAADPESEKDTFQKIISDFEWNIQHYWDGFQSFEGTTVSESDERIRNFLAMDYTESRENDSIRLQVAGPDMPVWFLLRLGEGTIKDVTGGSWKKVEAQVYLIQAEEPEVIIRIK